MSEVDTEKKDDVPEVTEEKNKEEDSKEVTDVKAEKGDEKDNDKKDGEEDKKFSCGDVTEKIEDWFWDRGDDVQTAVEWSIKKSEPIAESVCKAAPSSWSAIIIIWIVIPFIYLLILGGFTSGIGTKFPTVKDRTVPLHEFSERRVRDHLEIFDSFGTKAIFTEGNLLTAQYIKDMSNQIITTAKSPQNTFVAEVVTQRFPLTKYEPVSMPVENIMVMIRGDVVAHDSVLMISSHYDTAFPSIGSADAIHGVATMLELMTNILNSEDEMLYNVLFLFTNSEEVGFIGSDIFRDHEYQKLVKRFINLEAMSSRGRVLNYRVTASSLMDEISGIKTINSNSLSDDVSAAVGLETDYGEFKSQGLHGFDFAYYQWGYDYHTNLDTSERIPLGSIQQLGGTLTEMLNIYIFDINSPLGWDSDPDDEKVTNVWADFLGAGLMVFSETFYLTCSIVLICVSLVVVLYPIIVDYFKENKFEWKEFVIYVLQKLGITALYFISYGISIGFAIGCAILSALIASIIYPMAFYGNAIFAFITYTMCSLGGMVLGQYIVYLVIKVVFFHRIKETMELYASERWTSLNFLVSLVFLIVTLFGPISGGEFKLRIVYFLFLGFFSNFFTIMVLLFHNVAHIAIEKLLEKTKDDVEMDFALEKLDELGDKLADQELTEQQKRDLSKLQKMDISDVAVVVSDEEGREEEDEKKKKPTPAPLEQPKKVESSSGSEVSVPDGDLVEFPFTVTVDEKEVKFILTAEYLDFGGEQVDVYDIEGLAKDGLTYTLKTEDVTKNFTMGAAEDCVKFDGLMKKINAEEFDDFYKVTEEEEEEEEEEIEIELEDQTKEVEEDTPKEEEEEEKKKKVVKKDDMVPDIPRKPKGFLERMEFYLIDLKVAFMALPWLLFIASLLALYQNWDVYAIFAVIYQRSNDFPVPGIMVALAACVVSIFIFMCLLPLCHRAANFLKLLSVIFVLGFIFTIVLACLFPYHANAPKWINVECSTENAQEIVISSINGSATFAPDEFGRAWVTMKSQDVDSLSAGHPAFSLYKRNISDMYPDEYDAGEYDIKCLVGGVCDLELPPDEKMSRVFEYHVERLTDRMIYLEIRYDRTALSSIQMSPMDSVVWDFFTQKNLMEHEGVYYRTNMMTETWKGVFTVPVGTETPRITLNIKNVYNSVDAVPFVRDWFEETEWMTMAGWDRSRYDVAPGTPKTFNYLVEKVQLTIKP